MIARTIIDGDTVREEDIGDELAEFVQRVGGIGVDLAREGVEVWAEVTDPAGLEMPADRTIYVAPTPFGVVVAMSKPVV